MNILLLTTYFFPDCAIAAVRPYMFAKYLADFGHKVTVIRSGIFNKGPMQVKEDVTHNFKVISYMGENSPAEMFDKSAENTICLGGGGKSRVGFLPFRLRIRIACFYHKIMEPFNVVRNIFMARKRFYLQKETIDRIDEKFDVVFATYGELENVFAGEYAAKKYHCKYILDFRDLMALKETYGFLVYNCYRWLQKRAIAKANICTAVSFGLASVIQRQCQGKKVFILHNGYEKGNNIFSSHKNDEILTFCYTGALYANRRDVSPLFSIIKELSDEGSINLGKICFDYAGDDYEYLKAQASKYSVESILVNHGYVDRNVAEDIQRKSDIFVVLSWNTRNEQGILTGKFYEALRSNKPVLACVTGSVPNSELRGIIENYQLGICYEEGDDRFTGHLLKEYVLSQYNRKIIHGSVLYNPNKEVFSKFEYQSITKQLEHIMSL